MTLALEYAAGASLPGGNSAVGPRPLELAAAPPLIIGSATSALHLIFNPSVKPEETYFSH